MMINFTEQEKSSVIDIIDRYRTVSQSLTDYQNQAQEILDKVNELEKQMDGLKKEEDNLMENLHKKYGDFSLNEVYYTIYGEQSK